MLGKLDDLTRTHQSALDLRIQRQQLLASNIANADTPGYKAVDIDFAAALRGAIEQGNRGTPIATPLFRTGEQGGIDGNTVDMNQERARFSENALRMEVSITLLNGQLKSLLAAVQG